MPADVRTKPLSNLPPISVTVWVERLPAFNTHCTVSPGLMVTERGSYVSSLTVTTTVLPVVGSVGIEPPPPPPPHAHTSRTVIRRVARANAGLGMRDIGGSPFNLCEVHGSSPGTGSREGESPDGGKRFSEAQ